MSFWRECFSDNGQASASRVMMAFHAVAGAAWGTHVVIHTHTLPDAVTMGGLTAFVTAPYVVNSVRNAVTSFSTGGPRGAQ